MSHTPNFDAKIKTILDATVPGERVCPLSGERWMCEPEEIKWYRYFNVPPTSISPMTRRRWLTGFNLGLEMWWNQDALTGKKMLSYVHPDNPTPVVEDAVWFATDWSTRASAEIDLSRSLFDTLRELNTRVPVPALRAFNPPINTIGASLVSVEDSFMVFAGVKETRRCAYGWLLDGMEDCQEIFFGYSSSDAFFLNNVARIHHSRVVFQSQDCFNSSFLFDCRNCESVFGGFNLRNRKYVWWGEQLSKEAWEHRMAETDLRSWKVFQENMDRFLREVDGKVVWPETFNIQAEDSSGEYLVRCLRAKESFGVTDGTDFWNSQISHSNCERCIYASGVAMSSDLYQYASAVHVSKALFSSNCGYCQNIEYCLNCRNCEFCFGCVGLENKKFHIFNKPYSEEDYWRQVDDLKCTVLDRGEYGQFFPGDFSPAGVEFAVECFFDYPSEEFSKIGAVRYDPKVGMVQDVTSLIDPDTLPDHLDDCESYVGKALIDKELGRSFAIRKDDYKFYQKLGLPFPRRHYIARIKSLARMANTYTSSEKACANCSKIMTTADNLTFKNRKIYCQSCYLQYLEKNG